MYKKYGEIRELNAAKAFGKYANMSYPLTPNSEGWGRSPVNQLPHQFLKLLEPGGVMLYIVA
jgi:hypothetical protein